MRRFSLMIALMIVLALPILAEAQARFKISNPIPAVGNTGDDVLPVSGTATSKGQFGLVMKADGTLKVQDISVEPPVATTPEFTISTSPGPDGVFTAGDKWVIKVVQIPEVKDVQVVLTTIQAMRGILDDMERTALAYQRGGVDIGGTVEPYTQDQADRISFLYDEFLWKLKALYLQLPATK